MGFACYASNKDVKDFDATLWYWHPLWKCLYRNETISKRQYIGGSTNDGFYVDKRTTRRIAKVLRDAMKDGSLQRYIDGHTADMATKKDWEGWYNMSMEVCKEFADFCYESEGFYIY